MCPRYVRVYGGMYSNIHKNRKFRSEFVRAETIHFPIKLAKSWPFLMGKYVWAIYEAH